MNTRSIFARGNGDTERLLEMRAAAHSGDVARAREIESSLDMVQYAPGRYVHRSVLGTKGYEDETSGSRAYETRANAPQTLRPPTEDEENERMLQIAIDYYQSALTDGAE